MSGHSKWASIKHKKSATDAKRGKIFTKVIRELTIAARQGGSKIDTNPRLRLAIQKAKDANMPANNIERAIKKGTGELEGVSLEEITYEGYGPGGVAMLINALTDNKNRTTSDVRNIFAKLGGSMVGQGAVSWIFEKKGYFVINKDVIEEDKLMNIVLDAGAEDLQTEGTTYAVTTAPGDFEKVKKALEEKNIKAVVAELSMIPKSSVKVLGETAKKVLSLVETLEDNDDVQNVYANFDIPEEIIDEMGKE
ncbi:MAG: YebC/PmpR family DNA-binding transcriptional regulator [Candidatus Omnitrophica bacterium]|nr:YebC/PmpR family DNA-binding transcriptional regulator [Candidatus Omnitrophota bacterium]